MAETYFKEVRYTLTTLVDQIEMGMVGLPDIQRPFVWKNTKVRDLFDSMYRGYPVGYLLFWQNAFTDDAKHIGDDPKAKTPSLLIVGDECHVSLYGVVGCRVESVMQQNDTWHRLRPLDRVTWFRLRVGASHAAAAAPANLEPCNGERGTDRHRSHRSAGRR